MNKYFVSFTHKNGSGMSEVDYPEEIKGMNDVLDIKRCIEKDDNIPLPYFHKDKMYKGMELNKEYTLQELGLFEDE